MKIRKATLCWIAVLFIVGSVTGCGTDDINEGDNGDNVRSGENHNTIDDRDVDDTTDDTGTSGDAGSNGDENGGDAGSNGDENGDAGGNGDAGTGGDTGSNGDAGTGGNGDTGDDTDAGDNNQEPSACEETTNTSANFEIPASGSAYYARATFTNDTIWVSYVAVVDIGGGETEEKVHLIGYGCDGEIVDGPTMVSTDESIQDFHSAIASDDDTIYIVWVMEHPDGQRVMGRTFDSDGSPRQSEPFRIQPQLKDGEIIGTVWKPDVDVDHDGNAVIVVERLMNPYPRVLLQRIDPDGERRLNGFYVHESDDHLGQQDPAVTVMEDGSIQYAYLGGDPFDANDSRVYHGTVGAHADDPGTPPIAAQSSNSINNSVRFSRGAAGGFTWMTYPVGALTSNELVFRDATVLGATPVQSTSTSNRIDIFGDIAASETGGAVAWMSYDPPAPTSGWIHFQSFTANSSGTITNANSIIDQHTSDDATQPYGPTIVWLHSDVYAAIWNESDNGFSIHGRILGL